MGNASFLNDLKMISEDKEQQQVRTQIFERNWVKFFSKRTLPQWPHHQVLGSFRVTIGPNWTARTLLTRSRQNRTKRNRIFAVGHNMECRLVHWIGNAKDKGDARSWCNFGRTISAIFRNIKSIENVPYFKTQNSLIGPIFPFFCVLFEKQSGYFWDKNTVVKP